MPAAGGTPAKAKAPRSAKSTPAKATPKGKGKGKDADADATVDTTPTPTPGKRKRAPAKSKNAAADIDGEVPTQVYDNADVEIKHEPNCGNSEDEQNDHNRNPKRPRVFASQHNLEIPLTYHPTTGYTPAPISPGFTAVNSIPQDPGAAARLAHLHAELQAEVVKAQAEMRMQGQVGAGGGINGGVAVKQEGQSIGYGEEEMEQYYDALDQRDKEMAQMGVERVSEWLGESQVEEV